MRKISQFSSENYLFFSREILMYIAWARFRNDTIYWKPGIEAPGSKAVFICPLCTRVQMCNRVQINTRANLQPMRCVNMPLNCVQPYLDLI